VKRLEESVPAVEDPEDKKGSLVENGQGRGSADGPRRSTAWGFWLVLAAILVIAAMYSVTMFAIGPEIRSPTTAIGALSAAFAVVAALVGTYFGIKAGLDGQDKMRDTLDKTVRNEERLRARIRNEYE
jgi:hypothetical protein